ncbi:MAG: OB-fold domain-containing protein [Halioglobus sp.]|nr:OB-fold domain-containing protein [Halioglobus sp.]
MSAGRIKPPLGQDNGWWWEMAAEGKLGIQRCSGCGELRHPPRPMCGACRSLEWEAVESCGRGHIASYTVLRHPQFPGYEYPLVIVLVELEEGTRLTSQLVGCEPEQVDFDLPVQMAMHEDPDGFRMPVFRLAQAN